MACDSGQAGVQLTLEEAYRRAELLVGFFERDGEMSCRDLTDRMFNLAYLVKPVTLAIHGDIELENSPIFERIRRSSSSVTL